MRIVLNRWFKLDKKNFYQRYTIFWYSDKPNIGSSLNVTLFTAFMYRLCFGFVKLLLYL